VSRTHLSLTSITAPAAGAPGPSLRKADVDPAVWNDWRWQARNMITSTDGFARLLELSDDERAGLAASPGLFRVGATPYYASLMDPAHPECPIRRQAIPSLRELDIAPAELRDPLGEDDRSPAPCVVHKYPDRVLLLVVDRCAIYCRHCNRRRLVGGDDPPTSGELDAGIDYIARTPRIRDVLLSGGDPLLLGTRKLDHVLGRLRAIPHVEILRIGTRVPVVLPMRIDDELCAMLRKHHPLYVNTHFNHPREITPEARAACERLVDHGIPVGNQAVLLRGVNSSVRCMRALMRALVRMRVRPYYLFQGDTVMGTDHLRTPVDAAVAIMDGMRGWMSGMAIPHLVIDAPGGGGKIPVGPQYVLGRDHDQLTLRTYDGRVVHYPEPRERDCSVPYDRVFFGEDGDEPGARDGLDHSAGRGDERAGAMEPVAAGSGADGGCADLG
jgi:lysine 2,3-aminomutase